MARRRYGLDEQKILRFGKEGRGLGAGSAYKPWFTVADVPSRGRSHRCFWWKTGRIHQLLSDIEFYVFLYLIWGLIWELLEDIREKLPWPKDGTVWVEDIREQFPVPRRETVRIAKALNIRHPVDRQSRALWVVTTDLLVTMATSQWTGLIAIAAKVEEDLKKPTIWNSLQIEKSFWEARNVLWILITDTQVKTRIGRSLKWIFDGSENSFLITEVDRKIWEMLVQKRHSHPYAPIKKVCQALDYELSYKDGSALRSLRHLLACKVVTVDLEAYFIQDLPIRDFSFESNFSLTEVRTCQH